jgi:Bifunctional DNA primase/polymerase, N-terminal
MDSEGDHETTNDDDEDAFAAAFADCLSAMQAHREEARANSIVAPDCPLMDADLAGVRVVRSRMLDRGYRPLAVHSPWSRACAEERAGKAPLGKDWQKGQPRWRLFGDHPEWSRAGANTGLLLGVSDLTLQALDFDINEVTVMAAVLATVKPIVPRKPLIRLRANSPRVAMVLRCEPGALKEKLQGERGAVERLATGQQVVVHGTHPSGAHLEWLNERSPWTVQAAALPLMDEAAVAAMFSAIAASGALGGKLDRTSAKSHPGIAGPRGDIAVAFKACVTRCVDVA